MSDSTSHTTINVTDNDNQNSCPGDKLSQDQILAIGFGTPSFVLAVLAFIFGFKSVKRFALGKLRNFRAKVRGQTRIAVVNTQNPQPPITLLTTASQPEHDIGSMLVQIPPAAVLRGTIVGSAQEGRDWYHDDWVVEVKRKINQADPKLALNV